MREVVLRMKEQYTHLCEKRAFPVSANSICTCQDRKRAMVFISHRPFLHLLFVSACLYLGMEAMCEQGV